MSTEFNFEQAVKQLQESNRLKPKESDLLSKISNNMDNPEKCMEYFKEIVESYSPEDRAYFKRNASKFNEQQIQVLKAFKLLD
jgi:hypothetical protein